ncbi:MAG: response regulator, partial [Cyanobacteria bacterium J06626_14]
MNPKILTVLIIDDCFDDCYAYRRYLKAQYPHTLNIIETETGSEGLVELEHSVPEVILLDQFLPDMTGLEFLQQIQTQSLITPPAIIFLTRYGDEKLAKEAIQYGAQDYVPKESLTAERLSHAINQAISNLNLKGLLHRTQTL